MTRVKDRTLKEKVVALFVVFLTVVLGLCLFFFYSVIRRELENDNLDRMAHYAESFARNLSESGEAGLDERVESLEPWQGRLSLVDGNGGVLYESAGVSTGRMDNHLQRPEIQAALKSGAGSSLRYSITLRTHMHYYALKTTDAEGRILFIRLAYPLSALTRILYSFLGYSIPAALLAVFSATFLFWLCLTKRLFQPLEEIVRRSELVGTTETRFPIFRDAELQKLSTALNVMSKRLRSADVDIQSRREELARIIEALPIGIVLMDAERKVRYLNGVTRTLFGGKGDIVKGSPIERLIPSGEFYDMLDGPDACGTVSLTPVRLEEEALAVDVCIVTLAAGRLMTLRDVTEERRLEETRRNLTIDAGHELQTPLTAIRAAAELLLEELEGKNLGESQSLLSTILRQQQRMTSLIDDLLLLVKLENPEKKPEERTPENLTELLSAVAAEFRENPATRAIEFELDLPSEDGGGFAASLMANRPELLRAISNIVDNAARKCGEKYGAGPGGRVRLSLRSIEAGGFWAVTVSDNGPGVAPETASRIFKSFHGAGGRDRGKWGSGGHGLGLSIAARVVQAHGGAIDLLSASPLGGAAFEIRLPVKHF